MGTLLGGTPNCPLKQKKTKKTHSDILSTSEFCQGTISPENPSDAVVQPGFLPCKVSSGNKTLQGGPLAVINGIVTPISNPVYQYCRNLQERVFKGKVQLGNPKDS